MTLNLLIGGGEGRMVVRLHRSPVSAARVAADKQIRAGSASRRIPGYLVTKGATPYFPGLRQRRSAWVKIKRAYWRAVQRERRHDRS